jgi:hypothetical protein
MSRHNIDVKLYYIDPKLGEPNEGDANRIKQYPKNAVIVPGKIEVFFKVFKDQIKATDLVVYVQPFESLFYMTKDHYAFDMSDVDYNDPRRLFLKVTGTGHHFDPNRILKYYPGPNGNFIREFYDMNPTPPETNYYEMLVFHESMRELIDNDAESALYVLKRYCPDATKETLFKDLTTLMKDRIIKCSPFSRFYFNQLN